MFRFDCSLAWLVPQRRRLEHRFVFVFVKFTAPQADTFPWPVNP